MGKYQNLDAWKISMQVVKEIYMLIKKFPKEELYALTSQAKERLYLYHVILLKEWADNTKRIQFSFCIFLEAHCMNWKLC